MSREGSKSGYPDLWNLSPETDAIFNEIVLDGALEYAGMAGFRDVLSEDDGARHKSLSG